MEFKMKTIKRNINEMMGNNNCVVTDIGSFKKNERNIYFACIKVPILNDDNKCDDGVFNNFTEIQVIIDYQTFESIFKEMHTDEDEEEMKIERPVKTGFSSVCGCCNIHFQKCDSCGKYLDRGESFWCLKNSKEHICNMCIYEHILEKEENIDKVTPNHFKVGGEKMKKCIGENNDKVFPDTPPSDDDINRLLNSKFKGTCND